MNGRRIDVTASKVRSTCFDSAGPPDAKSFGRNPALLYTAFTIRTLPDENTLHGAGLRCGADVMPWTSDVMLEPTPAMRESAVEGRAWRLLAALWTSGGGYWTGPTTAIGSCLRI